MNPTPSKSKAAMWMAGWLSLMLVTAIAGREAGRELNVFDIMEIRCVLGLILLYPLVHLAGGFASLRTARFRIHAARGLTHYMAQLGWFYALTVIPLGQVISLEFTMPIWTAIFAASFLGERMTLWKVIAIVLGLIGVIMIVRPATDQVNPGQMIAATAAIGFGAAVVLMKSLTRTETAVTIVFWMMVVQLAAGAIPTAYVWTWPSPHIWLWLLAVSIGGTFSHFCLARAMRYADATIVVPMDFLRVPLSAAAGWLLYAERMDMLTISGAVLILSGNLLNLKAPAPRPTPVEA